MRRWSPFFLRRENLPGETFLFFCRADAIPLLRDFQSSLYLHHAQITRHPQ